ncbi:hypothetical protein KKF84_12850, partial [Myxococcota bacterium]|nr:hypothetical protein [Myxococcota bacterium]
LSSSFTRPDCTVGQVYPQLLKALCALMDHALGGIVDSDCWYGTFYRWFQEDRQLWERERSTVHHLQAFGGMGSFNDLVFTRGFPGGKAGFERFYEVYRLVKELSYTAAELWHEAQKRSPESKAFDVLIDYRGVPVSICTCSEGHRWMKEDLGIPYYASAASTMAEMSAGFELVAERGGEAAVEYLLHNTLPFDRGPVLRAMGAAVARLGLAPRPNDCRACRRKKQECEILYLLGFPMEASKDFFRVEMTPEIGN